MRIFETRHGQVAPKGYYKNDPSLPVGDVALSPLGKEQARLVAKRLEELQFKGVIFSSPYDRTLQTASIIAEELGCSVTPLACLHEIVSRVDGAFRDTTVERIKQIYPHVVENFELPARWWGEYAEDLTDVIERLKNGLKPILKNIPQELDVLLVGHAATSVAMRHLFGITENNRGFHWNCHLSLLYSSSGERYANDSEYIPDNKRTGNALLYTEQTQKLNENIKKACALTGEKVLHIGDTHSGNYGYYKALIAGIKPDVIIHTGDLVDELKAGRIENARPYWKTSAKTILKIMKEAGARVIIVAGNNDLEEELKAYATKAEIVPRNTVLELSGRKVLLCHELNRMDENAGADVFLYGHGLTGESRTPTDNERNGKLYFNATWGASVHSFENNEHLILATAQL